MVVCKGVACREMELTLPLAAGGGVSDSWSLGNGAASGFGFVSPQLGANYNYSFQAARKIGSEWWKL